MLEQLMSLIRENAGESIVNNPDVPNEHNEAVMSAAGQSITGTLQQMLANGQGRDVLSLFNTAPENIETHPAMQQVSNNFLGGVMEKFGLNSGQAMRIASMLLPMIISKFVNRTNDPSNNQFQLQDMFNQMSNNGTSGLNIPGLLNQLGGNGLDKDRDGDVDLSDLTAAFTGTQSGGSRGGLLDSLTGMLGGR